MAAGVAALRQTVSSAATSRNGVTSPLASERDKIAHLLRRTGFGYSEEELEFYRAKGLEGAVEYLLNYDQVPDDVEGRLSAAALDVNRAADLQRSWLLRMIYTRRPLQEKMALFWHGLLVSGTGKVGLPRREKDGTYAPYPTNRMLNQVQFFREHALDDWPSIMKGISRDPAMIVYLDSRDNRKGKPNENYAREVMELFTLGLYGPDGVTPNYTEQDVREAARALTGWTINREDQFAFNPGQHDTGAKTVFGKTGNFNGDDVIDLIMQHPSGAYYVCRRLWSFFAYDDPTPDVLQPVIDRFKASGLSIKEAVRAIVTQPAFYSERAYRAKVKAPAEYLAGMARALQLDTNANGFQVSAARMGQTLFNPPNVAGWPGGAQWFNSTAWLERVNQLSRILAIRRDPNTQPVQFLPIVQRLGWNTPEAVVDYFVGLFLDGQIEPEQRQTLIAYMRDGGLWPLRPGATLRETDPAVDRKVRGLVYLVMAMPEFHLA
jgi:uncharacterized protein (DUF1800 family)